MNGNPQHNRQAWSVLIVSTLAFTVCFMVWMMFGVIGIPIRKMLGLNATEFGLLTAMPVLTGSLVRVPLGIWTDRFGGRIVMACLMALTVPAIWLMSYATEYWHFIVIGLFVGLAGGAFSVGTPYVARWFPKQRQGMAEYLGLPADHFEAGLDLDTLASTGHFTHRFLQPLDPSALAPQPAGLGPAGDLDDAERALCAGLQRRLVDGLQQRPDLLDGVLSGDLAVNLGIEVAGAGAGAHGGAA